jgi:hypothetical protein
VSKHSPLFSLASLYWRGRRGARPSVRCLHHHQAAPHVMNGGRRPPCSLQCSGGLWWPCWSCLLAHASLPATDSPRGRPQSTSALFSLFLTLPSLMSSLFYTYPSSLFPQFLTPSPLKNADVLYGRPSRRAPRKEGSLCSFA